MKVVAELSFGSGPVSFRVTLTFPSAAAFVLCTGIVRGKIKTIVVTTNLESLPVVFHFVDFHFVCFDGFTERILCFVLELCIDRQPCEAHPQAKQERT